MIFYLWWCCLLHFPAFFYETTTIDTQHHPLVLPPCSQQNLAYAGAGCVRMIAALCWEILLRNTWLLFAKKKRANLGQACTIRLIHCSTVRQTAWPALVTKLNIATTRLH
jgi:hypothetical protein